MLLLGARQRDEDALLMLYDRYGGLVYTLALRVLGDHDRAEEVTQDVFLRCWHGLEGYDAARGTLPGWLLGIGRSRAIDALRGRQPQSDRREPATSLACANRRRQTAPTMPRYGRWSGRRSPSSPRRNARRSS